MDLDPGVGAGSGSAAAMALRQSFGDRKPIDISRKITACVACRKQKIKCHMTDARPPCTRCKKRGLSCVVNRSLQMLLEGDVAWKTTVEQRLRALEDTINHLDQSQSRTLPAAPSASAAALSYDQGGITGNAPRQDLVQGHYDPSASASASASSVEMAVSTASPVGSSRHEESSQNPPQLHTPQNPPTAAVAAAAATTLGAQPDQDERCRWEVVMDLDRGAGVVPASCVSEVSGSSPAATRQNVVENLDLVDRGIISLQDAECFFNIYYHRLDHFIYRILSEHDSLASVRKSSPLLTAAVCAVGALHYPSSTQQYQACYQYFVNLASTRMFSKGNTADDVRALCIGAFWLNDISWTLVGAAVRLAGELNLHRCIQKTPHTKKRACYLRTRLYYHVYVCDHHFSIAYGRPPLARDFSSVTPPSDFLKSPFATEDDERLVSQVEIWSINTRVFDHFSLDPDSQLTAQSVPQLRRLSIALDTWRADWNERLPANERVGNYPRKGVGLHFHFAKLFLCSHVFRRGPVLEGSAGEPSQLMEPDLEEIATVAIHAATAILQVTAADHEIQSYLHGLPAYFDTMIAFAFVFLLKVSLKGPVNLRIDKTGIADTLDKLVTVLESVTRDMHPLHVLTSIATSMRKLLSRFGPGAAPAAAQEIETSTQQPAPPGLPATFETDHQWLSPTDAIFLENYDFSYSPGADFNFDFDLDPLQYNGRDHC